MRTKLVSVLVVLLAAASLSACGGGGGGGVSPRAYLTALCRELGGWSQAAQDRVTELQARAQSSTTVDERKDILREYINGVISDTDDLIDRVRAAGFPDVPGGEQTADAFLDAFGRVKTSLENGRDRVDDLPDDPEAFQQASDQLGNDLESQLSSIGDSVQGIGAQADLRSAFAETPECQSVQT